MSVHYADDASKCASMHFWCSVPMPTLLRKITVNSLHSEPCEAPHRSTGLVPTPGLDRNPVATWGSKPLEPLESKESLVATGAHAKVGCEGGGNLQLLGWASLATP